MLVLTRKSGERVLIGDDVMVTVLDVGRGQVKIGISAPTGMPIYREEIYMKVMEENRRAASIGRDFIAAWEGTDDED
ncbi:MAG: carbon storage regulator CsrA [Deltaproteobacteria bacterium]|nr:carbon storage regulator CsrA [Deltaproteobacteria bacterium]